MYLVVFISPLYTNKLFFGDVMKINKIIFSSIFLAGTIFNSSADTAINHTNMFSDESSTVSTYVEINPKAFGHNLQVIRKTIGPNVKICAVMKADAYGNGIANLIDVESRNMNADIEKQLKTLLDKFEDNFQHNIIVKANDELKKLASHLQESGFKGLNFNLPPRKNLALNLSPARLMNNALIESEATKTGLRQKTGMFSGVSRWFGSKLNNDWGYEEYDYKVKEYKIVGRLIPLINDNMVLFVKFSILLPLKI